MTVEYVVKDPKNARNFMLFNHEPGMKYAVTYQKFGEHDCWRVWDLYATEQEALKSVPYYDFNNNKVCYPKEEIKVIKIYGTVNQLSD